MVLTETHLLHRYAQCDTDAVPLPWAEADRCAVGGSGVEVCQAADIVNAYQFEDVFYTHRHLHIRHIGVFAVAEVGSSGYHMCIHSVRVGKLI